MDCYDSNGDGFLNRTEFDSFVEDALLEREGCPAVNLAVQPSNLATISSTED